MAELNLNPITGRFDLVGMTGTEVEAYLKLNQTTHQHVVSGTPHFDKGIAIKSGEKLVFDGD
jgi:hypothetical protein